MEAQKNKKEDQYKYLTKAEAKDYRHKMHEWCQGEDKLLARLKNEKGINSILQMVGSAKRNLVIENATTGEFDFDYQLRISSKLDKSGEELGKLKEWIRKFFDEIDCECITKVENSTSVITIKCETGAKHYHYDLAILSKNENGNFQILHCDKKNGNLYTWNKLIDSTDIFARYKKIIKGKAVNDFRDMYLTKKKEAYKKQPDERLSSTQILVDVVHHFEQLLRSKNTKINLK